MKKLVNIAAPVLLALAVIAAVAIAISYSGRSTTAKEYKQISVFDRNGDALITTDTQTEIYKKEYWAYLEIALAEAAQLLADREGCTPEEGLEQLFVQGMQIYTAFDATAFDAAKRTGALWGNACNTATAITDLQGNLVAVCCSDKSGEPVNYARERRSPYSSFKALSVYTPAVEQGVIHWSTPYVDEPYKQIEDEEGNILDWPVNATGKYSRKNVPVYDALKTSLNTVAVSCLADVGVSNSIDFLQTKLGIPLEQEQQLVTQFGEEEIIGNIALGYLETGVTPVEMAGYYQMFANGGMYAAPRTVSRMELPDGAQYYKNVSQLEQVIRPETADTMNKLLQGVVAAGGTGEKAKCRDVEVAGKTGTGDDFADNWFVGVTPGYSIAVWHGKNSSNQAAEMFGAVVERLYDGLPDANRKFITHKNLYPIAYCTESGKAISEKCTAFDMGYYADQNALSVCDICGK